MLMPRPCIPVHRTTHVEHWHLFGGMPFVRVWQVLDVRTWNPIGGWRSSVWKPGDRQWGR